MGAPALAQVAHALSSAYVARHPGAAPPATGLAMALAQSIGEGAWAHWSESAGGPDQYPFEGTNNFGAIHATQSFARAHAAGGGYGMVAFLDHAPGPYVARMAVYPSLLAGATAFLALVEGFAGDLSLVGSAQDYATALYVHNYFEGFHPDRTPLAQRAAAASSGTWTADDLANIADYAALISTHLAAAQAAITAASSDASDPEALTHGPPFAPLALRLTPSQRYAPHTIEHARELLGSAADNPPAGAISIADAQSSPDGDGVWLFPAGAVVPSPATPAKPAPVARKLVDEIAVASLLLGAALGALGGWAFVRFVPAWGRA